MRKVFLLIVGLVALQVCAEERTICAIDFKTADVSDWSINNVISVPDDLGNVWVRSTAYGMKASGYSGTTSSRYETNSMLISPYFDLSNYAEVGWSFEHTFRYGYNSDITVWCDGGHGWEQLAIPNYPTGNDWTFVSSGNIDLSAYAGGTVRLGFRYTSTSSKAGTWEIQSMTLKGTPIGEQTQVLSVSEFLQLHDPQTTYEVVGIVQYIDNTSFGNFYLADLNDPQQQVYIYGLLTQSGLSQRFYTLGVDQGDELRVRGKYVVYTDPVTGDTKAEIVDAQYVSHVNGIVDTDWSDDLNGRWSESLGQVVSFSQPMYICGYGSSMLYIASSRLRTPEEVAVGLPLDSVRYRERIRLNDASLIRLTNVYYPTQWRLGSKIIGLQARVTGERELQAFSSLTVENHERPTLPPDVGDARLRICGANIQNYFYNWESAYAGAGSAEKFEVQTQKICGALCAINADIYALCEVENGQDALQYLVSRMNTIAGANLYDFVNDGLSGSGSVKCGYIYRSDKVSPIGGMLHPYSGYSNSIWYSRELVQGFTETATGEKLIVVVNHLKAKSNGVSYNADRMTEVGWLTNTLPSVPDVIGDPDIIMLGDYNSYSQEEPVRYLIAQGFKDELVVRAPEDYSYVYDETVGYLDHIFTSETMSKQVTGATVWHINADEPYSSGYSNLNTTIYRYADHDPLLIGLRLGEDMTTGVETPKTASLQVESRKILQDGQLFILVGESVYDAQGRRVK